jgi:hypothetical protein
MESSSCTASERPYLAFYPYMTSQRGRTSQDDYGEKNFSAILLRVQRFTVCTESLPLPPIRSLDRGLSRFRFVLRVEGIRLLAGIPTRRAFTKFRALPFSSIKRCQTPSGHRELSIYGGRAHD